MTLPCSLSSSQDLPLATTVQLQSLTAFLAQIGAHLTLDVRNRLSASTTSSSPHSHNHRRHRREQQWSTKTLATSCLVSHTSPSVAPKSNENARRRRQRLIARRALSKAVLHSAPTNTSMYEYDTTYGVLAIQYARPLIWTCILYGQYSICRYRSQHRSYASCFHSHSHSFTFHSFTFRCCLHCFCF